MSIYERIKQDWKAYCLMMAIVYIEEMSKPTPHIQIKTYKDSIYRCTCYNSVRLKMKDPEVVKKLFDITVSWEKKKKVKFVGKTFEEVRKENYSGQDMFLLTPTWLNYILVECGNIPNIYSYESAERRLNNLKHYRKIPFDKNKNLFNLLLKDKELAAGAFIISMDLEFRGIQNGHLSLCMSEKYKDFLDHMLKIAKKWGWTKNEELSNVSVEYSRKKGINASPQYEFRVNIEGLCEIYELAGPLTNSHKEKCINFNVNRSKNYINKGFGHKKNRSKEKILNVLKKSRDVTTTDLQFVVGTGTDVVLDHLHRLKSEGKVINERRGKRYIWNIK